MGTVDLSKLTTAIMPELGFPTRWSLQHGGKRDLEGPEYFEREDPADTVARMKAAIDSQLTPA